MIPTLQTLAMLCRVFGVDLSFFFAAAAKHSLSITRKVPETGNGRPKMALNETPLNMSAGDILTKIVEFPPGVVGN